MPPLRAREAIYSADGRGNLTDVCLYPGGEGFSFSPGMCAQFKKNMRAALTDPYNSMQSALRDAYDKTTGLPKGNQPSTQSCTINWLAMMTLAIYRSRFLRCRRTVSGSNAGSATTGIHSVARRLRPNSLAASTMFRELESILRV